jgi:hypothetical protein
MNNHWSLLIRITIKEQWLFSGYLIEDEIRVVFTTRFIGRERLLIRNYFSTSYLGWLPRENSSDFEEGDGECGSSLSVEIFPQPRLEEGRFRGWTKENRHIGVCGGPCETPFSPQITFGSSMYTFRIYKKEKVLRVSFKVPFIKFYSSRKKFIT